MNPEIKIPPDILAKLFKSVKGHQSEIAKKSNFDQSYVHRLLTGKRRVTTENVRIITIAKKVAARIEKEQIQLERKSKTLTEELDQQL